MPTTITSEGRHSAGATDPKEFTVTAGTTSDPVYVPNTCTVCAHPGAGGSVLVEATFSLPSKVAAGTARWFPWTSGTVSIKTSEQLSNAVAIRATATTQNADVEVTS